jgi:hypothetical protein
MTLIGPISQKDWQTMTMLQESIKEMKSREELPPIECIQTEHNLLNWYKNQIKVAA